ncbi:MAG: hypothetical protein F4Z28_15420 [Gammaproteobacteria bacterium]|nr:hypothetical protein [Gammaproteobacteria bacterium]
MSDSDRPDWDGLRDGAHELPDLIDDFLEALASAQVAKANRAGATIIEIAARIQLAVAGKIGDPSPPTEEKT